MQQLCALLGVALALAACGAAPSAAPAPTRPAPTAQPAQITAAPAPTAAPSATPAPSPTPSPTAASPTAIPSPSAAPTAQAAAPADEVIVRLHRSGGFAGVDESYSIRADGSVVKGGGDGQTMQIVQADAAAASRFIQQLADTGITALAPGSYQPKNPCCDRFSYTVSVVVQGQEYSYSAVEGDERMPAELAKLIELVRQYVGA